MPRVRTLIMMGGWEVDGKWGESEEACFYEWLCPRHGPPSHSALPFDLF